MKTERDVTFVNHDELPENLGVFWSHGQRFTGREVVSALSAARVRLAAAAEQAQRQNLITNQVYYGPGHREEPVQNRQSRGLPDAAVTRNHYGCLVLNAAHTLFIDVDVVSPGEPCLPGDRGAYAGRRWRRMLDDLCIVLSGETNEGFRIYRTAAGFRVLATGHEFEPGSSSAKRLMESTGADAAFVKLCHIQNSFRARLTPKPWRCGSRRPPNSFPRESIDEQQRFASWLLRYERACRNYATCRYVGQIGPNCTHKSIASVIEFHDRETRALEALPLA